MKADGLQTKNYLRIHLAVRKKNPHTFFEHPFDVASYIRIYFISLLWPSSSLVNTNAYHSQEVTPQTSTSFLCIKHFPAYSLFPVLSIQIFLVFCFFLGLQATILTICCFSYWSSSSIECIWTLE